MQYKKIFIILSKYLFFLAGALCLPLLVAFYFDYLAPIEELALPNSTFSFIWTILITLGLAIFFRLVSPKEAGKVYRREGVLLVVTIWFLTGIIGGIPYYLSNTFEDPVDCFFESISGFTTTGASVMQAKKYDAAGNEIPYRIVISGERPVEYIYYGNINPVINPKTNQVVLSGIEAVSLGVLFWRSLTQWLGGMGIVVLFVAILPALGVGGKLLFHGEVPGPIKDTMTPRIKETARIFWKIYCGLTLMEIILLLFVSDMSWYDASTVAMSTLSTGGFSIYESSISYFNNVAVEWVVILFMVLGGLNFTHYVHCLRRKFYHLFEPELGMYLLTLVGFSLWAAFHLVGQNYTSLNGMKGVYTFFDALRSGFFQVISAQTSTGFATVDFSLWPFVSQTIMLGVMYLGGMAGSTAGGIKVIRHYLMFNILKRRVEDVFRPEAVRKIRIGESIVDESIQMTVLGFIVLVIILSFIGTFAYIINGIDFRTAITVNACMINNIGLAFGMAGPTYSFAFLPIFSKLLSCLWMVLGRLEFFVILILFIPGFWKSTR